MPFGSTVPFVEPLWYSRGKSPYYKASHERLRAVVRKYVDESITPFCEEWETQGSVPKEVITKYTTPYTALTLTRHIGRTGLKETLGARLYRRHDQSSACSKLYWNHQAAS